MTELSHAIAANIANRPRQVSPAERAFLVLNAAADGIGEIRRAVARLAVKAADGIGFVRLRAMKAAPALGSGLAETMAEARQARAEAEKPVPGAVQRRWRSSLKKHGRSLVREYLDQTAHLPATAPFLLADTGLTHGATRYPTRAFALDWAADAPEDDGGIWRTLTICAIFGMIGAGVLFWVVL